MYTAEVRSGYIYVKDTETGQEKSIYDGGIGKIVNAVVTGDDKVTVTYESGPSIDYRISTGNRYS